MHRLTRRYGRATPRGRSGRFKGTLPNITVAPVLTWAVSIGSSPVLTAVQYIGAPASARYTYRRDGVAVDGLTNVTLATINAHVGVAADIGPSITVLATVTTPRGTDTAASNAVTFNDVTLLPTVAIYLSTTGLTLADSDTTVSAWARALGGLTGLGALTATNRPAYNATGGVGSRPLITFDGTNDDLTSAAFTKGSIYTQAEMGFCGKVVASGSTGDQAIGYSTAGTLRIGINESASATLLRHLTQGASGATTNFSTVETTSGHWSMNWTAGSPGTQEGRLNGTVEASSAPTVASYLDGGVFSVGANAGAANFCNLEVQAVYFSTAVLSSTERAHLRALLSYHTGFAA